MTTDFSGPCGSTGSDSRGVQRHRRNGTPVAPLVGRGRDQWRLLTRLRAVRCTATKESQFMAGAQRYCMRLDRRRHVLICTADRLQALTQRALQERGESPPTLAIAKRFERVAALYSKATLGEMARQAWRYATICYAARGDAKNAERCASSAEVIPQYVSE
jgi:hypothetical protein